MIKKMLGLVFRKRLDIPETTVESLVSLGELNEHSGTWLGVIENDLTHQKQLRKVSHRQGKTMRATV
jgi:hypothetical protein